MAGERARKIRQEAGDATTAAIQALEETGELRHLYGRPLDLGDDSPDWLAHKILKQQGFAPPLIERGKDLDTAQSNAEKIVERLRRKRTWLASPEARCTAERAHAFNEARLRGIEEYRTALTDLNRAILNYNLSAPGPLHRRGFIVDTLVAQVEREIPPLDELAAPQPEPAERATHRSWLRCVREKLRAGH